MAHLAAQPNWRTSQTTLELANAQLDRRVTSPLRAWCGALRPTRWVVKKPVFSRLLNAGGAGGSGTSTSSADAADRRDSDGANEFRDADALMGRRSRPRVRFSGLPIDSRWPNPVRDPVRPRPPLYMPCIAAPRVRGSLRATAQAVAAPHT